MTKLQKEIERAISEQEQWGSRVKEVTVNVRTWARLTGRAPNVTFLTLNGVPIRCLPFQYNRFRVELF